MKGFRRHQVRRSSRGGEGAAGKTKKDNLSYQIKRIRRAREGGGEETLLEKEGYIDGCLLLGQKREEKGGYVKVKGD